MIKVQPQDAHIQVNIRGGESSDGLQAAQSGRGGLPGGGRTLSCEQDSILGEEQRADKGMEVGMVRC